MKYLKEFKLFEADEMGTDDIKPMELDLSLNDKTDKSEKKLVDELKKQMSEYEGLKSKMEEIFKDPKIKTDSDLENSLLKNIYHNKKEAGPRNKLLMDFEAVLRGERRKNAIQNAIESDKLQITNLNNKIIELEKSLSERGLSEDMKERIGENVESLKKRLKEVRDNVTKNKEQLNRDLVNWRVEHEEFKKDMQAKREQIKNMESK